MKKQYVAPELEKLIFTLEDIITHSNATGDDNSGGYDAGDQGWWTNLVDDTWNLD